MKKLDYLLLKVQERQEQMKPKKKKNDYLNYFVKRIDHQWDIKPPMHVCHDYNFTAKRYISKCPRCGSDNIYNVGYCAKPPKKNASKKKWKEFWDKHGLKKDNIWH